MTDPPRDPLTGQEPVGRDRLRELLDAVTDASNSDVGDMARSSYASEFHFSREVRRLTGESPAALRRRVMLERAAWRLQRGEAVPPRSSTQPEFVDAAGLAAHHDEIAKRWRTMVSEYTSAGRLGDTVIDALCDPPESFQLYGIVAHVLTYSAYRRELARAMLAGHGVTTRRGDPLDWMRGT